MRPKFKVFISAVSSEFEKARRAIKSDLVARGLEVKEQEDFRQEADTDTTLSKLAKYIRECDAVVALIGTRSGGKPTANEAAPHADALPAGITQASYTQWEVFLARRHGRRLSFYVANDDWTPDRPALPEDDGALQAPYRDHLFKAKGLDRTGFSNTDALCRAVLREEWPKHPLVPVIHPRFSTIGDLFQGRDDDIEKLKRRLDTKIASDDFFRKSNKPAIRNCKPIAICGAGGVGKSRLAFEFFYRHQSSFSFLLYADAESGYSFVTSVGALRDIIDDDILEMPDARARFDWVMRWLAKNDGWGLLIDNADSQGTIDLLQQNLSNLSRGLTIFTTRFDDPGVLFDIIRVEVLSRQSASALIISLTDGFRSENANDNFFSNEISERLDFLALSITYSCQYIRRRRNLISLENYNEILKKEYARALEWKSILFDYRPNLSLYAAFQVLLSSISFEARAAIERLSFLDAGQIGIELFESTIFGYRLDDILNELIEVSLINVASGGAMRAGSLTMHRLVKEIAKESMDEPTRDARNREAVRWVLSIGGV